MHSVRSFVLSLIVASDACHAFIQTSRPIMIYVQSSDQGRVTSRGAFGPHRSSLGAQHASPKGRKRTPQAQRAMDIPHQDAYSIPTGSEERENIPQALATVLGGCWSALPSNLEITQLQGGITNRLYVVKAEKCPTVLVRVYGENTEVLISREMDIRNFSLLTANKFGPKLLGYFKNGRVEEFFDSAKTLEPADLSNPQMQERIARELQKMHSLDIPMENSSPTLFVTMDKWFDVVAGIQFDDEKKQTQLASIGIQDKIHGEIRWVKDFLATVDSPVVFAHNDLLSGNILFRQYDDKILFVDFEYGSHNFRGFDLGNHFNEYAGFDFELYPSKYPDKESQINFLKAYDIAEGGDGSNVERLYVEANSFALASNLFWGLWAIVQAKYSVIDFDFLTYGEQRFAGYYWLKSNVVPALPR